jgi:hypothetical protein
MRRVRLLYLLMSCRSGAVFGAKTAPLMTDGRYYVKDDDRCAMPTLLMEDMKSKNGRLKHS